MAVDSKLRILETSLDRLNRRQGPGFMVAGKVVDSGASDRTVVAGAAKARRCIARRSSGRSALVLESNAAIAA